MLVSKSSKLFLFIWSWFLANLIFWMSGIMYEKLWRFWGILSCSIKDLTFWGQAGEVRQITFFWWRTDIHCWGCECSCSFSEGRRLVNVKFKISLHVTIFIWKISPGNGKKIISISPVTHPPPSLEIFKECWHQSDHHIHMLIVCWYEDNQEILIPKLASNWVYLLCPNCLLQINLGFMYTWNMVC